MLIGGPQLLMKFVCLEYGDPPNLKRKYNYQQIVGEMSQEDTNSITVEMNEYSRDTGVKFFL